MGAVLDRYPALLDTFLAFGFQPLSSPLLRRTMARQVTIASACRHLNVAAERFVAALNEARASYAGLAQTQPPWGNSFEKSDNDV